MRQKQKTAITWIFAALLTCALVCGLAATGKAGKLKEYSADQVRIKDGKTEQVGKIYVATDKIRTEMRHPGGQGTMILIMRQDKKVAWTLFPEKKTYFENAIDEKEMEKHLTGLRQGVKTKEEDLGTETVNGYKCKKRRIETNMEMMGHKITSHTTVWTSDELGFPLRTEADNGVITEMRNVDVGSQPSSLFEVPSGWKRTANMMEAIGDMDEGRADPDDVKGTPQMPPPKSMEELMKRFKESQGGQQ